MQFQFFKLEFIKKNDLPDDFSEKAEMEKIKKINKILVMST